MMSFVTGVLVAVVLACGSYFAMQAGTITMPEKWESVSTVIDDVWQEGWFRDPHPEPVRADGS